MPARAAQDDYDSPWKEAVEHAFPEFMEFYFPDASSAKSPEAPTEPCSGTHGITSFSMCQRMRSTVSTATPE